MYKFGKCKDCEYIYQYNTAPHPMALAYSLCITDKKYEINKIPPLNNTIHTLLLIPNKYRNYLKSSLQKIVLETEVIFKCEECKKKKNNDKVCIHSFHEYIQFYKNQIENFL